MSWNEYVAAALLAVLSGCAPPAAVAAGICPAQKSQPLRFVDVFDGPPEELATLIPDSAQARSGYWKLGYVYDSSRIVTIRCRYADGKTLDVKLPNRVDKCNYKINAEMTLTLYCN